MDINENNLNGSKVKKYVFIQIKDYHYKRSEHQVIIINLIDVHIGNNKLIFNKNRHVLYTFRKYTQDWKYLNHYIL